MINLFTQKFKCHWGLPGDYRSWEKNVRRTPHEIVALCKRMDKESWVYVYFPRSGCRLYIEAEKNGFVYADLQYTDPLISGVIAIETVEKILINHTQFLKNTSAYGLTIEEND